MVRTRVLKQGDNALSFYEEEPRREDVPDICGN